MPLSRERRTAEETESLGRQSPLAKKLMRIQRAMEECETPTWPKVDMWRGPEPCNRRKDFSLKCKACKRRMARGSKLIHDTVMPTSDIMVGIYLNYEGGDFHIQRHRKRGG